MTVDQAAVDAARDELGIRLPVRVKFVAQWKTQGTYIGADKGYHEIVIRETADNPDRSLWHELTHAKQREGFDSDAAYDAAYWRQWEGTGLTYEKVVAGDYDEAVFRSIPFEGEAEGNEWRASRCRLVSRT